MKKVLYCAAALALLLFSGSCQKENLEPVQEGSAVTFIVEAPAGMNTKAIADGTNVDELVYEVWITNSGLGNLKTGAQKLYQATAEMKLEGGVRKVELPLDLVNDQKFTVLFWAQKMGTGVYDTQNLNAVTYMKAADLKDAYAANDERLAAFYGVAYVDDNKHVTKEGAPTTGVVKLRRPFAQINLGTLNTSTEYDVVIEESDMIVSQVPTVFNVVNGDVSEPKTIEFLQNAVPSGVDADLLVNNKTYSYAGMNYVFAGDNVTVEYNIQTKLVNKNTGDEIEVSVNNRIPSVPVKENFRTNIVGNLITSQTDYEIIIDASFRDDVPAADVFTVTTDEQLEEALQSDAEEIHIILGADLDLDASDANRKLGSADTKKIVFDGTKVLTRSSAAEYHTLNLETGYWSRINTVNPEATVVMRNLNLTSSQTSGTWNSYDVIFKCNVEMENVNLLKALAFDGVDKTAVLKNVNITETNDYYALWIAASGMDVEWTGGTISSEGRGIKIDEEYVDTPAATNLKVSGVDFNTKKKAAIIVKSSAEVNIEVSDINIEDVAADKVNAVWVDEDAEDHFDLVTVKGATKILEGMDAEAAASGFFQVEDYYVVNTAAGLKAFAESVNAGTTYAGKTVKLDADLDLQNEPWTPIGPNADAAAKFAGIFEGQGRTISNLKVETAKGYTAAGLFGSLNGTARNFTIDGASVSHISTGAVTDNGIAVVAGSLYNRGHVENVTVLNAAVNGNRYVGAIAGFVYGNIKGCTVKNVTLTATPDKETGSYDNGDKVGAIAGYFVSESVYVVTGNVVENATIVGYRDMGVVVGAANGADAVYGNTVKGENYVTVDRNIYYGDKDDNAGEVVGRITAGNLGQNTVEGTVTITHPVASAEINAAIKDGGDYTFEEDVEGQASSTNGYGKTGITQTNGGTIDGNGHTLDVPQANATWDCAINTTGGTIKNLTIASGFRGIFVNHNSQNCSKVYLENVVIDGPVYTISCDQGSNKGLEAVGSTFKGWTSYAATIGDVKFTDCDFGEGSGYAYCRPYAPTTFVECDFEAGYVMEPLAPVVFIDCTVAGQALTSENLSTLVTSDIRNATVAVYAEEGLAGLQTALASGASQIIVGAPVEVTGNIEIDLNGKTLKAETTDAITVPEGAKLTIGNGNIVSNGAPIRAIGGEVVIESGKYVQTGTALGAISTYRYAVDAREGGKVTVNGGEFESGNGLINVNSGSEVVINGGKFTNKVAGATRHLGYISGKLTVNDGEFHGVVDGAAGGCFFCGAAAACDILINGGKFTSLYQNGAVNRIFEVYYGGTINVTGGLFNTNGGIASFVEENTDPATKDAYPYVAK